VERIAGFSIVATAVAALAVFVATGRLRAEQVRAEIAGWNRVLRLQGIRRLVNA
jgi:hypothetical protein